MERSWIKRSNRKRARGIALAAIFVAVGMLLWVAAATLHVAPAQDRDVSFGHLEARSLGVVAGGVAVAGGIALLAVVS